MYAEFAAVVHSLNHLTSLLKSANSLSNYNDLVAAVSEVNSRLLAAQSVALGSQEKQASQANEIAELKDKLRTLEHFKREAERYELKKLEFGGLVFAMKKRHGERPTRPLPLRNMHGQRPDNEAPARERLLFGLPAQARGSPDKSGSDGDLVCVTKTA